MHDRQKHEFAFFYAELSSLLKQATKGTSITISDEQLYYRIWHVVRLAAGETVLLFDTDQEAHIILENSPKKNVIHAIVHQKKYHQKLSPAITVMLPVLKREALEEALYSCVELGATTVQLVLTKKVQRSWTHKDFNRLTNIMIAAAEQSKNFSLPLLLNPLPLYETIQQLPIPTSLLCCSIDGERLLECLSNIQSRQPQHPIVLLVGPEGDFVSEEYEFLKQHSTTFCSLTPTVLRSQQALVVALGALRSVMR